MAYSDFTIARVKRDLGVRLIEGSTFFPDLAPIPPSDYLRAALAIGLPLAQAKSSEKSRSELVISPILLALRESLDQQISLFSGEDFSVDPFRGLTGTCDFLISRSTELLTIEAPAIFIVEAKKSDLNIGLGQCIAEMVAAKQFNEEQGVRVNPIYGATTSGLAWKFLRLHCGAPTDMGLTIELDLTEYSVNPIGNLLAKLCWMCQDSRES